MGSIHPTAVIDPAARIASGAEIGPYCVIGADVTIGEDCRLVAHVHVAGHTDIGRGCIIHPFASLGAPPQSVHYHGGATRLIIGADCDIREGVTINIGTEHGGGLTEIGNSCFLMACSHVGHDCHVGNRVTFANNAVIGGHVSVGDNVFLGGNSAVHQFVRIGEGAMIGGLTGARGDVIPFGYVLGQLATLVGLNVVGLRRLGYSRSDMHRLRRAYQMLFDSNVKFDERVVAVIREFADDPLVGKIVTFLRSGGKRPLTQPAHPRHGLTIDTNGEA